MAYSCKGNEVFQLYFGDCMEALPSVPDGSVDMVMCDLPYGTTDCPWDTLIPFDKLWEQYNRVCKENAAVVLTAQPPFDKVLGVSNLKNLRYEWIWIKNQATGFMNANKMPLKAHENILVFYRKLPTFNPQKSAGTPYRGVKNLKHFEGSVYGKTGCRDGYTQVNNGSRSPKTELHFDVEVGLHPTQKPTPLMEYLIKTYTNPGETVLDNTMGSGTTGVAAVRCGRNFIGMESDPTHFAASEMRITREYSQLRMF
jgi:DNA modification methylase